MPRSARKLSNSQIYHVVIKGADRQILFENEKDFKKYLDILAFYKAECHFKLFAFCLMSNHIHLLIYTNGTPIDSIFRRLNTNYATWFNHKYDRTGFVQDGRYYSEPVENASYFISALRYIHFNPTQAGLEEYPGEKYKWSSIYDYIHDNHCLVDIDYAYNFIGDFANFLSLHKTSPSEKCLEIDTIKRRLPDDVAKDIIKTVSHCDTSTEFQELSLLKRNKYIAELHKKGVSIRQLNRLTGTPRGVISRIIEKIPSNQSDAP